MYIQPWEFFPHRGFVSSSRLFIFQSFVYLGMDSWICMLYGSATVFCCSHCFSAGHSFGICQSWWVSSSSLLFSVLPYVLARQDAPYSFCVVPAFVLECVICTKNPGSFYWKTRSYPFSYSRMFGCFQFLEMMNEATTDIRVHRFLCGTEVCGVFLNSLFFFKFWF